MDHVIEREQTRCPRCGGLNPAGAKWCGQCHARYGPSGRLATPPPPPPPPPPPGPSPELVRRGAFSVTEEGITWDCGLCGETNALDATTCSVCGAPFADTLRPRKEPTSDRDPNTVALYSLFFPGAGHAYLGLWGQAIARAVLSLWVGIVAVLTTASGGLGNPVALLFSAVGLGLWLVAAHDAYREATGAPGAVLLKPRYFLYLVLGLVFLLVVALVGQGLRVGAGT